MVNFLIFRTSVTQKFTKSDNKVRQYDKIHKLSQSTSFSQKKDSIEKDYFSLVNFLTEQIKTVFFLGSYYLENPTKANYNNTTYNIMRIKCQIEEIQESIETCLTNSEIYHNAIISVTRAKNACIDALRDIHLKKNLEKEQHLIQDKSSSKKPNQSPEKEKKTNSVFLIMMNFSDYSKNTTSVNDLVNLYNLFIEILDTIPEYFFKENNIDSCNSHGFLSMLKETKHKLNTELTLHLNIPTSDISNPTDIQNALKQLGNNQVYKIKTKINSVFELLIKNIETQKLLLCKNNYQTPEKQNTKQNTMRQSKKIYNTNCTKIESLKSLILRCYENLTKKDLCIKAKDIENQIKSSLINIFSTKNIKTWSDDQQNLEYAINFLYNVIYFTTNKVVTELALEVINICKYIKNPQKSNNNIIYWSKVSKIKKIVDVIYNEINGNEINFDRICDVMRAILFKLLLFNEKNLKKTKKELSLFYNILNDKSSITKDLYCNLGDQVLIKKQIYVSLMISRIINFDGFRHISNQKNKSFSDFLTQTKNCNKNQIPKNSFTEEKTFIICENKNEELNREKDRYMATNQHIHKATNDQNNEILGNDVKIKLLNILDNWEKFDDRKTDASIIQIIKNRISEGETDIRSLSEILKNPNLESSRPLSLDHYNSIKKDLEHMLEQLNQNKIETEEILQNLERLDLKIQFPSKPKPQFNNEIRLGDIKKNLALSFFNADDEVIYPTSNKSPNNEHEQLDINQEIEHLDHKTQQNIDKATEHFVNQVVITLKTECPSIVILETNIKQISNQVKLILIKKIKNNNQILAFDICYNEFKINQVLDNYSENSDIVFPKKVFFSENKVSPLKKNKAISQVILSEKKEIKNTLDYDKNEKCRTFFFDDQALKEHLGIRPSISVVYEAEEQEDSIGKIKPFEFSSNDLVNHNDQNHNDQIILEQNEETKMQLSLNTIKNFEDLSEKKPIQDFHLAKSFDILTEDNQLVHSERSFAKPYTPSNKSLLDTFKTPESLEISRYFVSCQSQSPKLNDLVNHNDQNHNDQIILEQNEETKMQLSLNTIKNFEDLSEKKPIQDCHLAKSFDILTEDNQLVHSERSFAKPYTPSNKNLLDTFKTPESLEISRYFVSCQSQSPKLLDGHFSQSISEKTFEAPCNQSLNNETEASKHLNISQTISFDLDTRTYKEKESERKNSLQNDSSIKNHQQIDSSTENLPKSPYTLDLFSQLPLVLGVSQFIEHCNKKDLENSQKYLFSEKNPNNSFCLSELSMVFSEFPNNSDNKDLENSPQSSSLNKIPSNKSEEFKNIILHSFNEATSDLLELSLSDVLSSQEFDQSINDSVFTLQYSSDVSNHSSIAHLKNQNTTGKAKHSFHLKKSQELASDGKSVEESPQSIKKSQQKNSFNLEKSQELASDGKSVAESPQSIKTSQQNNSFNLKKSQELESDGKSVEESPQSIVKSPQNNSLNLEKSQELESGGKSVEESPQSIKTSQQKNSFHLEKSQELASDGKSVVESPQSIVKSQQNNSLNLKKSQELASDGKSVVESPQSIKTSQQNNSFHLEKSQELESGGKSVAESPQNIVKSQQNNSLNLKKSQELASDGKSVVESPRISRKIPINNLANEIQITTKYQLHESSTEKDTLNKNSVRPKTIDNEFVPFTMKEKIRSTTGKAKKDIMITKIQISKGKKPWKSLNVSPNVNISKSISITPSKNTLKNQSDRSIDQSIEFSIVLILYFLIYNQS